MTTPEIKEQSVGNWQSIAPEVRPGSTKNADGTPKPLYLTRDFSLSPDDSFELTVTSLADPVGKMPLAKMLIKGHIEWKGEHPIAQGAQKVDFIADKGYEVTPLLQGFVDILNQYTKGFTEW